MDNPTAKLTDPCVYDLEDQDGDDTRRVSLDLFKAPFGWRRRRRATCASSDLRRMVKLEQNGTHDKTAFIESAKYDWEEYSQPYHTVGRNEPNENVILKSSRYRPKEQEQFEDDRDHDRCLQFRKDPSNGNAGQQSQPSNPFLVSESNEPDRPVEARPDILWKACVSERRDHRQSWAAAQEGRESSTTNPKKQLELETEQQEKEKQEAMEHKAMSGSRMSMTRSTTDTMLTQYQDYDDTRRYRRRASTLCRSYNAPPSASSFANRTRRNSVVNGRNITREQPPRSLRTGALPRPEAEPRPSHQHDDQSGSQEGYEATREDDSNVSHDSWIAPSVHPFDRPWRSGSLTRREFQSYAQDFMKDTDHWVPRPWTMTTSTCSSPSSPLHQRIFPHEREDHDTQLLFSDEDDEPIPESGPNHQGTQNLAYLDMKKIQLRPYREEEDGSDHDRNADHAKEDVRDDYGNTTVLVTAQEHGCNTGLLPDRIDTFQDNDHDIGKEQTTMAHHETRSGSTLNRSRDLIARRATLAKNKFYKLLKQPSQYPHDQHQHHHHHHYGVDEEDHPDLCSDPYLDEKDDLSRSESSMYSVTSSLRARMRLNSQTKTVLRQVKRRLSSAAKSVMSEANKAASNVSHAISEANKAASNKTPVSRYNTLGRKKRTTHPPSTVTDQFADPGLENVPFGLHQDYGHSKAVGAGQ
ncbi:MAG: hypothetical protein J3Q66DRAFT_395511 [Benniella sp.]|nr:MAG: hypothetical protein J3Q66DRAFT_395511 [Benniella sp.]